MSPCKLKKSLEMDNFGTGGAAKGGRGGMRGGGGDSGGRVSPTSEEGF